MRTPFRMALIAAVGLIALATVVSTGFAQDPRQAEPFAWQSAMTAGSTLEIKGVNGAVQAVPSTGSAARVEAMRRGRRDDPSEVVIEVVEHAGGVTICAVYPAGMLRRNECLPGSEGRLAASNNDVQVAFMVEVPAGVHFVGRTTNGPVTAEGMTGQVEAFSTNGDVRIEGGSQVAARTTNGSVSIRSSGEASASTTNGRITAELGRVTGTSPLRFSSTNGTIAVTLPADVNATIEARTSNGTIQTDLPLTIQGTIGRRQLTGTIGTGGTPIELRTTNGSIQIRRGA